MGRDYSQLVTPGEIVDPGDHTDAQKIIRRSGPEQMVVKNGMLFVTMLHSEKVEAFRIEQNRLTYLRFWRHSALSLRVASLLKAWKFRPTVARLCCQYAD
jgi:hypothetical protein